MRGTWNRAASGDTSGSGPLRGHSSTMLPRSHPQPDGRRPPAIASRLPCRQTSSGQLVFMGFLYLRFCFRLENICREWHVSRVFKRAKGPLELICVLPSLRPVPIRSAPVLGKGIAMLDVILVALGLGFFAATIAYAYACEQL